MAWTGNFYIYFIFHFHPVLGCYATQHETFYIYIYMCVCLLVCCVSKVCASLFIQVVASPSNTLSGTWAISVKAVWEKSHTENGKGLSLIKNAFGEREKKKIPASFIFIDLLFILRRRKKEKRITYEQNVPEYHFLFYSGPRCFLCNVLNRHNSSPQSRPAGEDEEWYNWLFHAARLGSLLTAGTFISSRAAF